MSSTEPPNCGLSDKGAIGSVFIERMLGKTVTVGFRAETCAEDHVFNEIAIVTGRFALAQPVDVSERQQHRHGSNANRKKEAGLQDHDANKERRDAGSQTSDQIPEQIAVQSPGAA